MVVRAKYMPLKLLRRLSRTKSRFALIAMIVPIWGFHVSIGQNLKNSGQITNNGTIRLKGSATGLPSVIDGRFEYFGANQTIMPRQYQSLILSGSGTKTMALGTVTISDTLKIASDVTLTTAAGFNVNLLGELVEQGYLSGSIFKTVDLSGGAGSSSFGNIGATISWTGLDPGTTTATRNSGTASVGLGKQSILRYYDVAPTFGSALNGSFTFRYTPNELNGRDPNSLELWRSTDGGTTWRRQGGTNLPAFNAIVKTGIVSFSRWTASDTSNLLGPAAYEWVAYSIGTDSGDGQSGPTGGTLLPFVVTTTDFFGNPIPGVSVTFVIDSIPPGATGQSLSATTVPTDPNGKATTVLTLGNQSGVYRVRAISGSLIGSPRTFLATATTSAREILVESGNGQRDSIGTTLSPFEVRVNDVLLSPVAGVPVTFVIDSVPSGAGGFALSRNSDVTNGLGIASTTMRLGNKVGPYAVRATTSALPGVNVEFRVTATSGVAVAIMPIAGATVQQDTILNVLDSAFVVRVNDRGGNGVPNVSVQFTLGIPPPGATGQLLSVTNTSTDTNGIASTRLTLGSKVGTYQVTATSGTLTNITFNAQAMRGAPAMLAEISGTAQMKVVRNSLDTAFVARVTDIGGNAIPGIPVSFAINSVPITATGQTLTITSDTTDLNGEASTILTLGTKVGPYTVVATAAALPGDTTYFVAQGLADVAAQIVALSGDGQTQPTGSLLQQPFVITVSDTYGNVVPGDTVQFVVSAPSGATGYSLTATNVVTDALGQAQTTLRLGNFPGNYTTSAIIAGLPPVPLTATATLILADVNSDFDVNIADLTSIIDHLIGRRILTSIDSVKADVNRDGIIDVTDALTIRDDLLGVTPLPKVGQTRPVRSAGSNVMVEAEASVSVVGELEMTSVGLRLNITNDIPIKGIQLFVRLKVPVDVSKPDLVFNRAKDMNFFINSKGQELYMVAFNLQNLPIVSGSGSLVRLPLRLSDTTVVDSAYAIVSTQDTSFDIAIRGTLSKKMTARPTTYALLQNYPNPFNPHTTIEYEVPEMGGKIPRVAIQIFNILGQKVKTIDRGEKDSGRYKVIWDGRDDNGISVPSGVYFYRLLSEDFATSKKMVLVK